MSDKAWFAIHSRPRMEHVAARELKRQKIWTFYPFQRVRRRRKMPLRNAYRVEWIETPYLPRYLFALARPDDIARINDTAGVSTVVYFGGRPLPIPGDVMDAIISRADGDGAVGSVDTVSRRLFRAGEQVAFADNGPFAGLITRIAEDVGGAEVKVWMDMLGVRKQVPVSPEALRRAGTG